MLFQPSRPDFEFNYFQIEIFDLLNGRNSEIK